MFNNGTALSYGSRSRGGLSDADGDRRRCSRCSPGPTSRRASRHHRDHGDHGHADPANSAPHVLLPLGQGCSVTPTPHASGSGSQLDRGASTSAVIAARHTTRTTIHGNRAKKSCDCRHHREKGILYLVHKARGAGRRPCSWCRATEHAGAGEAQCVTARVSGPLSTFRPSDGRATVRRLLPGSASRLPQKHTEPVSHTS